MTRFRLHDEVAVVEHDDRTREPKPGGEVMQPATVTAIAGAYVKVRTGFGATLVFWAESGWTAWDGMFQWRLVPLCSRPDCGKPVLAPVSDPEDRAGRTWCSEGCLEADAEASYEQRYQPGVAT